MLLVLDHLLHLATHRLRKVTRGIEWSIVPRVEFWLVVVDVHASAAREVTIADEAGLNLVIFTNTYLKTRVLVFRARIVAHFLF